jgi:hypothetical protein
VSGKAGLAGLTWLLASLFVSNYYQKKKQPCQALTLDRIFDTPAYVLLMVPHARDRESVTEAAMILLHVPVLLRPHGPMYDKAE